MMEKFAHTGEGGTDDFGVFKFQPIEMGYYTVQHVPPSLPNYCDDPFKGAQA